MAFNTFGPDLTSFLSLTSVLVSRHFNPLGGERDGPRVHLGDLERRGRWVDLDLELLEDV